MAEKILLIDNLEATTHVDVPGLVPAGLTLDLADAWDEATQRERIADANYVVIGGVPLTASVIDAGPKLRLIQKLGVGVDKIDLDAAARRGIPVAITAGANSAAVAEQTFLLMLALYRRFLEADASIRAGTWARPRLFPHCYELADKTLGLIGFGNIGKQVAKRAAAFDLTTRYYDIVRPAPEVEARLGAQFRPFDELLAESDIISIHVPWTHSTHHMIDERALARMKPSAVLINTARGEVVDEAALEQALRAETIAGAGLDVVQREPVREPRPIFELPNVVFTPHIAGMTRDTRKRMWRHAFENCARLARGEALRPEDLIDVEVSRIAPVTN